MRKKVGQTQNGSYYLGLVMQGPMYDSLYFYGGTLQLIQNSTDEFYSDLFHINI